MEPIVIAITLLTIAYLYLAIRNNPWCFVVAIVQCGLWGYHVFFNLGLFFDTLLQIFYILMSIWGIIAWRKNSDKTTRSITWMGISYNVFSLVMGIAISLLIAYLYELSYSANMVYLDAITTGFAIIATVMMIYRKIDYWIYFVFIDLAYVYIYIRSGDPVMAGIMVLYTGMAIYGFYTWKGMVEKRVVD